MLSGGPVPREPDCTLAHGDGHVSRIALSYPRLLPSDGTPLARVDGPLAWLAGLRGAVAARFRAPAAGRGA